MYLSFVDRKINSTREIFKKRKHGPCCKEAHSPVKEAFMYMVSAINVIKASWVRSRWGPMGPEKGHGSHHALPKSFLTSLNSHSSAHPEFSPAQSALAPRRLPPRSISVLGWGRTPGGRPKHQQCAHLHWKVRPLRTGGMQMAMDKEQEAAEEGSSQGMIFWWHSDQATHWDPKPGPSGEEGHTQSQP